MGRIHAKHLDELGVEWDYHDPFVAGGVPLELQNYSHVIVSTPIETHYDVYKQLDLFEGQILIEKPVVCKKEHLGVLEDQRIFPGLVERYNPVSQKLFQMENVVRLDFSRHASSNINPILDVCVHDFDLAFMLLGDCEWEIQSVTDRKIESQIGGIPVVFAFKKSQRRQRKCLVNGNLIDFDRQTFNGEKSSFQWPVKLELKAFLAGDRPNLRIGYLSHQFMAECLHFSRYATEDDFGGVNGFSPDQDERLGFNVNKAG